MVTCVTSRRGPRDASQRAERSFDPDRSGNADGPTVPLLLDAGAAGRRIPAKRLPAGPGEGAVGASRRVPRQRGALRPDRRVLSAPRRVTVVRPQRRMRTALPLSRLEIRRHRPMRRGAVGAEESGFARKDQAAILSAGGARRRAVDLYGSAGAASRRCRNGNLRWFRGAQRFVSKRIQESNWLQAMEGGIDSSHVSFLHRGNIGTDPLFKGAKGNQYNLQRLRARFSKWWRAPAGSTSAPAAMPRTATTTGASPNTCCRPSL